MVNLKHVLVIIIAGLFLSSCTTFFPKGATVTNPLARSHFGVQDKAFYVPPAFDETEAAIAKAEASEGAKYCSDKLVQARAQGKKAAETYWACNDAAAAALLTEARKLAAEAEACQPPSVVTERTVTTTVTSTTGSAVVEAYTVYFAFDKSILTGKDISILNRVVELMKNDPKVKLELQGNTDSYGSDAYNMKLGQRRADAVLNYLMSKGIESYRLRTISFGESKPAATNRTREGRALNRRVDLVRFDLVLVK